MNEEKTTGAGFRRPMIRILAALLAVALLATLVLANAIRVRIHRIEVQANAASLANNYLLENTDYAQLSAWERVQQVVRQLGDQASLESHYEKASIAIAQGENETALEHVEICLEMVERNSAAYDDLKMKQGCLLALLEDYEQAKTVFAEVLRTNPASAEAWLLQAQLLMQSGDIAGAMEHMERYLSYAEGTADQLSVMAQLCYGAGEYERTMEYGEQSLALVEDDAGYGDLYRCMAYAALLSGDDRAAGYFDAAVARITEDGELRYYRGVLRLTEADYEGALEDFDAAVSGGYATALVYYNRGVCHLMLEHYEALQADMQMVVERNEDEELTAIAQEILDELAVGLEPEAEPEA